MQTQTFINVDEIIDEKMRRHEIASQYAASARTKLWISKSCTQDDKKRLSLIREAIQDIKDGMSILNCGFVRPIGVI